MLVMSMRFARYLASSGLKSEASKLYKTTHTLIYEVTTYFCICINTLISDQIPSAQGWLTPRPSGISPPWTLPGLLNQLPPVSPGVVGCCVCSCPPFPTYGVATLPGHPRGFLGGIPGPSLSELGTP